MASMTNYLANALRDHTLRATAYTSPASVHLALFSTVTTEAGGGTEVAGGSYARLPITFIAGALNGEAVESGGLTFTDMPAVTVVAMAIFDAATAGNMLFHGRLPRQRAVLAGESFPILTGDLRILLD